MMTKTTSSLLMFCMLLISAAAQAGTMYVTDRIVLDLYEEDSGISPVIKQLPTGTPMSVIEVNGPYAHVRLKDGTTGWVESGFLTDEKPMQNLYTELMGKYKALEKQVAAGSSDNQPDIEELTAAAKDAGWMKVEMNKARDEAKSLKEKLGLRDKELAALKKDFEALKKTQATRSAQPEIISVANVTNDTDETALSLETIKVTEAPVIQTDSSGIPIGWFIGIMPVLFVLGVVGGIAWLDRRIRARHGGMRLY